MKVSVEPLGIPRIDNLNIVAPPEYAEQIPGGFTTAEVKCVVPRGVQRFLRDARITISPQYGLPWLGRIDTIESDGGVTTLTCIGPQADYLRMKPRAAIYADSRIDAWDEYTGPRTTDIECQKRDGKLIFIWRTGTVFAANSNTMFVREVPETDSLSIAFSWARDDNAYDLKVYTGVLSGSSGEDGNIYDWTLQSTVATAGTGANTGSTTITATVTNCVAIGIKAGHPAGFTASADKGVRVAYLNVNAVDTSVPQTVDGVVNHSLDQAPAWCMVHGSRQWLATDDTSIVPLAFPDYGTTEQDIQKEAIGRTTGQYGFWSRIIEGKPVAVPVYVAAPTRAAYRAYVDGSRVRSDYAAESTAETYSDVRVTYENDMGLSRYADKATTIDNWLTENGIERWRVESTDDTSASGASAAAQRFADEAAPVRGSLEIRGPIADANGGIVYPSEIVAGRIIDVFDPERGAITARIVTVEKRGDTYARVEFDITPSKANAPITFTEKAKRRNPKQKRGPYK